MWFDKHNQATHQHKAQNYLAKISLCWLILPYNQCQQLIRLGTLNTITFKRATKCVNWGDAFSAVIFLGHKILYFGYCTSNCLSDKKVYNSDQFNPTLGLNYQLILHIPPTFALCVRSEKVCVCG